MHKNKKVLVIKLCCLGDIIQTTPAVRAIFKSGAEVHYLHSSWVTDIVEMIPFVSKRHLINPKNLLNLAATVIKLRHEKYDLVVNFHRDKKSYLFASSIGAKKTAGFKGLGYRTDYGCEFNDKDHEGQRYIDLVKSAGFNDDGNKTEIKAPSGNIPGTKGSGMIGLFPGGGKNPGTIMVTKRWPAERFVELINMIKAEGLKPVLFGGESDNDVIDVILESAGDVERIRTGSIKELADEIVKVDAFIAGDTGPLHMSAALGTKTIGLFGPSSADLVGVKGEHTVNIQKSHECSPCYEPGTVHKKEFLNCTDNECMKKISAQEVMDALRSLTGKKAWK